MKYLTFGFDDGEIYDRQLADLFRKYGMKATFFLMTDQFGIKVPFHRYGEDTVVERVSESEVKQTYKGMEVAGHGANHSIDENDMENTVIKSLEKLSRLAGYKANGVAYPGGSYSDAKVNALRSAGVDYARTIDCTNSFSVPDDFLKWHPTCKYDQENVMELAHKFVDLKTKDDALFYIYGHSYELTNKEVGKRFCDFEEILKVLSNKKDICYLTNAEVFERLTK